MARPSGLIYLIVSVLVIILDQLTKYLTVSYIDYGTAGINVTPFFNLVHVYNEGAAFSFLAGMGGWQRYLFSAVAVVISIGLIIGMARTPRSKRWTNLACALFLGGAIGNLIDRLVLGYVVDFLLFYVRTAKGVWAYPAFNVADIAVCTGAALLVITALFSPAAKNKKTKEQ